MNQEKYCMDCGTKHPIYAKFCMNCNSSFDRTIKASAKPTESKYGDLTDSFELNEGTIIHRLKKLDLEESVDIGEPTKIRIGDIAPAADTVLASMKLKGKKAAEFVKGYIREPARPGSGETPEDLKRQMKEAVRKQTERAVPFEIE